MVSMLDYLIFTIVPSASLYMIWYFRLSIRPYFIEAVCDVKGHVLSAEDREKAHDLSDGGFVTKCQRCRFDIWIRQDMDDEDFYRIQRCYRQV